MASPGTYGTDDGVSDERQVSSSSGTQEDRRSPNGFGASAADSRLAAESSAQQMPTVVLLAGTLSPSPLRAAIELPVLCLPLGRDRTVLDAWLRVLADVGGLGDVRVVGNDWPDDGRLVRESIAASDFTNCKTTNVRPVTDPAAWRGTAGIVHDVTADLAPDAVVLVIESHTLPPDDLAPVLERMNGTLDGIVGICGADVPAGVYAFRRAAFANVPDVGYIDLKEQLLPQLAKDGANVRVARLGDAILRLRELEGYLDAVARDFARHGETKTRIAPNASVSGSAMVHGTCVIETGAVVEDGAVVHDSVVLRGATVGGGAVVSRSLIGPLALVRPRATHVGEVVAVRRRRRQRRAVDG